MKKDINCLTLEERKKLLEKIEKLSYLKDDDQLQVVNARLKQNYREEILKIKNWSLEDLVSERLKTQENEYEEWLEQNNQKLEEEADRILNGKDWLQKHTIKTVIYNGNEYSSKDFFKLTVQEVKQLAIDDYRNNNIFTSEELMEYFKVQKEKYDGIIDEELDEYVELLVQKQNCLDSIKLKECEYRIKNNSKPIILSGPELVDDGIIEIEDIRELPEYFKEAKKRRKISFIYSAKFISILFTTLIGTNYLLSASLLGDFVSHLLSHAVGLSSVVAFSLAVSGLGVLIECLDDKKVVKNLKESGLYDLYFEAIKIREETDSKLKMIEEKGMVK